MVSTGDIITERVEIISSGRSGWEDASETVRCETRLTVYKRNLGAGTDPGLGEYHHN